MKIYHKLEVSDGYVLDPFKKEESWIYRRATSLYFDEFYGLTLSQVWNLSHDFDKDKIHYCKYCGSPLKFKTLGKGFGQFCSNSCSSSYHMEDPDRYDNTIKSLNSIDAQIKSKYTQFLNKGDYNDKSYFYIAKIKNWLKFGITSDLDSRGHCFYQNFEEVLYSITGSRLGIARLERDLKYKLNQSTEYFEFKDYNLILKLVKDLYSTLINDNNIT